MASAKEIKRHLSLALEEVGKIKLRFIKNIQTSNISGTHARM
jgi:hypothetical protein